MSTGSLFHVDRRRPRGGGWLHPSSGFRTTTRRPPPSGGRSGRQRLSLATADCPAAPKRRRDAHVQPPVRLSGRSLLAAFHVEQHSSAPTPPATSFEAAHGRCEPARRWDRPWRTPPGFITQSGRPPLAPRTSEPPPTGRGRRTSATSRRLAHVAATTFHVELAYGLGGTATPHTLRSVCHKPEARPTNATANPRSCGHPKPHVSASPHRPATLIQPRTDNSSWIRTAVRSRNAWRASSRQPPRSGLILLIETPCLSGANRPGGRHGYRRPNGS